MGITKINLLRNVMNNKKFIISTLVMILVAAMLISCSEVPQSTQKQEQQISESRQKTLLEIQPPPEITYSLERENISERTTRFNDANKVSYIYLLSDFGQIYAFYPVKGKVSSVNSAMTIPQQIICHYSSGASCVALDSPQEDGSYGTNGDAIFFFTTENVYVEWNGKYMLVDQPLQLTEQPLMMLSEEE